jgi:hypothetical protein
MRIGDGDGDGDGDDEEEDDPSPPLLNLGFCADPPPPSLLKT